MEYIIGVIIGVVIAATAMAMRRVSRVEVAKRCRAETNDERKKREADEVVTIILPTINHDQ